MGCGTLSQTYFPGMRQSEPGLFLSRNSHLYVDEIVENLLLSIEDELIIEDEELP